MKPVCRLFAILFLSVLVMPARAQVDPFEDLQNQIINDFNDFQKKTAAAFNSFVDGNDKAFSDFLRQAWSDFSAQAEFKPDSAPKPVEQPVVDPVVTDQPVEIVVEPMLDDNTIHVSPEIPLIEKTVDPPAGLASASVSFYGLDFGFEYDPALKTALAHPVSPEAVADSWDKLCAADHYPLINQLLEFGVYNNFNDWAYYVLVRKVAREINNGDTNEARLLTWFLLSKSRYKAKLGYSGDKVYVLVAANDKIFSTSHFLFENLQYYCFDEKVSYVKTIEKDYPDAVHVMGLSLDEAINLGYEPVEKDFTFSYLGYPRTFTLAYNRHHIDFYQEYPMIDVKGHLDAVPSAIAKESVKRSFVPMLEGKSEYDAVGFLLAFVQHAFPYKTDPEQFGDEKFFFPEELLFFPFSDCEDRSALFAWLVKELLGSEVIGLKYPGHIATAVLLGSEVKGDKVAYGGTEYLICDPTFINAPPGMCMPEYETITPGVILLENRQSKYNQQRKSWQMLTDAGCRAGSAYSNAAWDTNGNLYVTGSFSDTIQLAGTTYTTQGIADDVFLAKFDAKGNLLWFRHSQGRGGESGRHVTIDKEGNIFLAGTFDRLFSFEGKELAPETTRDMFLARFSAEGTVEWLARAQAVTGDESARKMYVAKFKNDGSLVTTIEFTEVETFDSYGISFDKNNNCYVTYQAVSASDLRGGREAKALDASLIMIVNTREMVDLGYHHAVAGLFAFIETINTPGNVISGASIQKFADEMNPAFKFKSDEIYETFGVIELVRNTGGDIFVNTKEWVPITLMRVKMEDDANMQITLFDNGNAKIDFLSGASYIGASGEYPLNSLRIFKDKDECHVDYDADHSKDVFKISF